MVRVRLTMLMVFGIDETMVIVSIPDALTPRVLKRAFQPRSLLTNMSSQNYSIQSARK